MGFNSGFIGLIMNKDQNSKEEFELKTKKRTPRRKKKSGWKW
jgi:hypothetical protein